MSSRIRAFIDQQAEIEHGFHRLPDIGEGLIWGNSAERRAKRLDESLLAGWFFESLPQECGRDVHDKKLVVLAVEKKHFVLERGGLNLWISSKGHGSFFSTVGFGIPAMYGSRRA